MKRILLLVFVVSAIIMCHGLSIESKAYSNSPEFTAKKLRKMADADMKRYYFDNVDYISTEFHKKEKWGEVVYDVSYSGKYMAYDGEVAWSYYYDEDTNTWKKELIYWNEFDWNINGLFIDTDKVNFLVDVYRLDTEKGTISLSSTKENTIYGKRNKEYNHHLSPIDYIEA